MSDETAAQTAPTSTATPPHPDTDAQPSPDDAAASPRAELDAEDAALQDTADLLEETLLDEATDAQIDAVESVDAETVATQPLEARATPRLPMPQPQVTVLQPLINLKDAVFPTRPPGPEDESALLATWSAAMESALRDERPADAVRLAHVVLRQLPRHLPTYYRLIRAAWMLRRWEEGDAWGRRLLRADPANALAWRAAAYAAEQRAERARAQTRWQRAFECDPYEPETRAGLVRTSVDLARLPTLNEAALATLHLRGGRWDQAITQYRMLAQEDSRRLDFQSGLLIALWQSHTQPEAYEMARRLSQAQPYMLIAWTVVDAVGDADDRALARHPLSTMDPDGDYLRSALILNAPSRPVRLTIKAADRELLAAVGNAAAASAQVAVESASTDATQ